jgi:hypothetical protein
MRAISEVHPDIGQEGASAASVETRTRLILSSAFGHNTQRERIPKPSSMRGVIRSVGRMGASSCKVYDVWT